MAALSDGTAAAVEEPDSPSSPAVRPGGLNKGGSKAVSMSEAVLEELQSTRVRHGIDEEGKYSSSIQHRFCTCT